MDINKIINDKIKKIKYYLLYCNANQSDEEFFNLLQNTYIMLNDLKLNTANMKNESLESFYKFLKQKKCYLNQTEGVYYQPDVLNVFSDRYADIINMFLNHKKSGNNIFSMLYYSRFDIYIENIDEAIELHNYFNSNNGIKAV